MAGLQAGERYEDCGLWRQEPLLRKQVESPETCAAIGPIDSLILFSAKDTNSEGSQIRTIVDLVGT